MRHATEAVTSAEEELTSTVNYMTEHKLAKNVSDFPPGAVLDLGDICVVLLEMSWGWLTPEGTVHPNTRSELAIHPKVNHMSRISFTCKVGNSNDSSLPMIQIWVQLEEALSLRQKVKEKETKGDEGLTASQPLSSSKPALEAEDIQDYERERGTTLHSLLVLSPVPLLPTGAPKNVPAPGLFSIVTRDLKDLLSIVARWQSGDLKRAVLLAGGGNSFTGYGVASPQSSSATPWKQQQEGDDVKEVWEERSALLQIAVGPLTSPPTGPLSSLPKIPASIRSSPATASGGIASHGFSSVYNVEARGRLGTRTFWEVCPLLAPQDSTGEGATFELMLHSDRDLEETLAGDGGPVSITLGPVIGRLTSTSVTFLMETSNQGYMSVLVVDQVTGVEFTVTRHVVTVDPVVFYIDGLLPRRPYVLAVDCDSAGYADIATLRVSGGFTTPSDGRSEVEFTSDQRALLDLRREAEAIEIDEKARIKKKFADEAVSETVENDVIRILLVGALVPIVAKDINPEGLSASNIDGIANSELGGTFEKERNRITQGYELIQLLKQCLQAPWSPIDLTLHIGHVTDLSSVGTTVMSLLAQAEKSAPQASQVLVDAARSLVYGAYKLHWGADGMMSEILSYGSHLPVSCPVADVCHALGNASSLAQVARDYSPVSPCLSHLPESLFYPFVVLCDNIFGPRETGG